MNPCAKCSAENPDESRFCGRCGSALKRSTSPIIKYGVPVMLVLMALTAMQDKSRPTSAGVQFSAPSHTPAQEKPEDKVHLKNFEWSKGGFGTVMLGHFTIRNDNDYAVKDLSIRCDLSANSGTVIDTTHEIIYETIPAKETKTFREVSMGFIRAQTAKAGCRIDGVARF